MRAAKQEAARAGGLSAADKNRLQAEIARMQQDLNDARKDVRTERAKPRASRAAPAAAPIVVQGGAGGGGASSSAGGSSAASGGGSGAAPARAPDLSGIVEAAAEKGSQGAKGAKGSTKGITKARRSYTDKRKIKLAEMRALKAKRIREFNTKTKKMAPKARQKARREFSRASSPRRGA